MFSIHEGKVSGNFPHVLEGDRAIGILRRELVKVVGVLGMSQNFALKNHWIFVHICIGSQKPFIVISLEFSKLDRSQQTQIEMARPDLERK